MGDFSSFLKGGNDKELLVKSSSEKGELRTSKRKEFIAKA
jgi:hypothetical protein